MCFVSDFKRISTLLSRFPPEAISFPVTRVVMEAIAEYQEAMLPTKLQIAVTKLEKGECGISCTGWGRRY